MTRKRSPEGDRPDQLSFASRADGRFDVDPHNGKVHIMTGEALLELLDDLEELGVSRSGERGHAPRWLRKWLAGKRTSLQ